MMPTMTEPIMTKVNVSSFGFDVGTGVACGKQQKSTVQPSFRFPHTNCGRYGSFLLGQSIEVHLCIVGATVVGSGVGLYVGDSVGDGVGLGVDGVGPAVGLWVGEVGAILGLVVGTAVGTAVGANEGTYVSPAIVYVRDGRRREMGGRETVSERERA